MRRFATSSICSASASRRWTSPTSGSGGCSFALPAARCWKPSFPNPFPKTTEPFEGVLVVSIKSQMPLQVWILTLSAFAIGTAEFVIAGVLPEVASSLRVTEGQAGNLITAYAFTIVVAGPILTLWLARFDKRNVLIGLMALFIAGNLIGALTTNYSVLLVD